MDTARRRSAAIQARHAERAAKWNVDDFPYPGMSIEAWEARIPPEVEANHQRGVDGSCGWPAAHVGGGTHQGSLSHR
jgi:hypothetical protein